MLFLSVRGFSDYAGPNSHSRLARLPYCLPPTLNGVGILIYGLFAAQWPRLPVPLSTLQETPRDVPSKTRGQDGFATSFPVGLLHPLHHAGLARRTQSSPSTGSQAITVPTVGKQRAGFAASSSRVHNRTRCTFLILHSRNVWSAPKGTLVFSTRKRGVVYSLTAVPN